MTNYRFKFRVWNEDQKKYDDALDIALTPSGELMELYCVCCNYVIEQCSGLRDKTGKLIFEGDLLRYSSEENKRPSAVVFHDNMFALKDGIGISYINNNWKEYEIVGNIHEAEQMAKIMKKESEAD